MDQSKRIPVTILTGFLGAGKTTLLNELIAKHPNTKFAIIENEFGEIGIDNELVISAEDGIFEMSNGCLCCTLNDELVETLNKLLTGNYEFDHLLVETTGIAEPDGIAAAFVRNPAVEHRFQLQGTVCLTDAQFVLENLHEREEARRQVSFADFIILNKQSEVEPAELSEIEAYLKSRNPFAEIERADFAKVQTDVLNLSAYNTRSVEDKLNAIPAGDGHDHIHHHHHEHSHDHDHHHHHDHDHEHGHDHSHPPKHDDIVSQSYTFDQPFDALKMQHWLNALLMIQGQNIYRVKGVLNFAFRDERVILQSVRKAHMMGTGRPWEEGEKRESKIVFIGKGLKRKPIERSLRQCLYKEMFA